jgi:Holliday junction resolvasome RuvABC endonuclease subunit
VQETFVNFDAFQTFLFQTPMPVVWISTFVGLVFAYALGSWLKGRIGSPPPPEEKDNEANFDGYIVSGVVGLLALLMGFTFSLAVDRFDTRRVMVIEESNAIGTTYLRAQTFAEPHRGELSRLLKQYVDVRLAVAQTTDVARASRLLAESDALQASLWAVTIAAIAPQRDDVSATFMETMNSTIDIAAARKAARLAHVPQRVFVVLFAYMIMTAAVLGYVIATRRRGAVLTLLVLLTVSFMLIIDIDSPNRGRVRESQAPMVELKAFIAAHPPESFGTLAGPR